MKLPRNNLLPCREARSTIRPKARSTIRREARSATGLLSALLAACALIAGCGGGARPLANPALNAAREQNIAASRLLDSGNPARAIELYRQSLKAAEAIEDFELAASNLSNLALAHARLAQWRDAHAAVDRVIGAPQRYGTAAVALAGARKALIHLDEGALDDALRLAQLAEQGCPSPCGYAATLANLRAQVALMRGANDEAARHAARAADLAGTAQPAEQATALRQWGRALSLTGRHTEAAQALARALSLDKQLGASAGIALDLIYAGDNEARRGDLSLARDFHQRALTVYTALGDSSGAALARARLTVR